MTDYIVSSGVILSGFTLSAGDQLSVLAGGVATGTLVLAGGIENVSSGGLTAGETISGGEYVFSGGRSVGASVGDGGYLVLYPGATGSAALVDQGGALDVSGSAADATLIDGGVLDVYSGGRVTSTAVDQGGSQVIFAGGVATGTDISYDGADYVSSGGIASASTVTQGAYEVVLASGEAYGTVVSSGGADDVESHGVASAVTVLMGGAQVVFQGGVADASVLHSGGVGFVYSGGKVSGTQVQSGAWLVVLPGAAAPATSVATGGLVISNGVVEVDPGFAQVSYRAGLTSGGAIEDGSQQFVLPGGSVASFTLGGGSTQHVYAGGTTSRIYLNSGAFELVSSGGVAGGSVASGGTLYLFGGSVASDTSVRAGGIVLVASGMALATTLLEGGQEYVYSTGRSSGTVISGGGGEYIFSTAVDSGSQIDSGGSEVVYGGGAASNLVVASGGEVTVDAGGVISAIWFEQGGTVDLAYLPYAGSDVASLNSATDVLTVTEGSATAELQLEGIYGHEEFGAAAAGSGGTAIKPFANPCYCRGTRILTDHGEVAVEELAIGDMLVTYGGGQRPIRWIGRRAYAARFAAGNSAVQPILVKRGALAEDLPRRDLMISPQHALLLDGVLVPVSALVNGGSIAQTQAAGELAYFHLELETHDVIIAEGVPAESFLDDRNRNMFQNASEYGAIYPGSAHEPGRYCAPRRSEGPEVAALRERLARRSEACGYGRSGVITIALAAGIASFIVPAWVGTLHLVSEFGRIEGDLRWLGALITAISIDGRELGLQGPGFADGWNAPESHEGRLVRWTTGDARLMVAPKPADRSCEIEVAKLMKAANLPRVTFTLTIERAGLVRTAVPAGAAEVGLRSTCGWVPGDIRRLGALVTRFAIGEEELDLAGPRFGKGFHPTERHGARLVRWTNGEAAVAIAPKPAARWCEIEVAAIIAETAPPSIAFTFEIAVPGRAGFVLPAGADELRLVSNSGPMPGDARCLGALVTLLAIGGDELDLADACFAEGFYAEEDRGDRMVRWTDGDAIVMVEARPVERWCEIEIAAVGGTSGAATKIA